MSTWAELMEEGKKQYMAGEFTKAASVLREAAALQPESAETWRALGFAYKENGNTPDAIGAFNSAIKIAPDVAEGHFGLGMVYSEKGDQALAVKCYDEALRLKPNMNAAKGALMQSLLRQAKVHLLNGETKPAQAALERAYDLFPHLSETVLPFVERLVADAEYKKALDVAEAARKLSPHDARIKEMHKEINEDPRLIRAKREHSIQG